MLCEREYALCGCMARAGENFGSIQNYFSNVPKKNSNDPKFFLDRSKNCSGMCQKSAWRSVWRLSKVSLRIRSMQTFPSCIVTFCMTAPLSLLVRLCDISVRMHLFFQTLHVSGFMPNYGESKAQGMFCIVSQREIRRAKRELPHTTVL